MKEDIKKEMQEQIRINFDLQSEYDSYEEWFEGDCRELGFMENDSPGDREFSQNFKHALEDVKDERK